MRRGRRRIAVFVAPANAQLVADALTWLREHDQQRVERRRDVDQELAQPRRRP